MSELVERVAKALLARQQKRISEEWGGCDIALVMNDWFREDARAAIEAMLEPTEAMVSAAAGALKKYIDALPSEVRAKSKEVGGCVFIGPLEKHAIRYKAMIAEELK